MPENKGRKRLRKQEFPEEMRLDFGGFSEQSGDFHPMTPMEMVLALTKYNCNSYIGNGKFKSSAKLSSGSSSEIPQEKRREPVVPLPIAIKIEIEDDYEMMPAGLEQNIVQKEGLEDQNDLPPKLESPQTPGSEGYEDDEMPMLTLELSNSLNSSNSPMPALTPENLTSVITDQSSPPPSSNNQIQQSSSKNHPMKNDEFGDQETGTESCLKSAHDMFGDMGILTDFERMIVFTKCDYRGEYPFYEENQGRVDGNNCFTLANEHKRPVRRPRKNYKALLENLKAHSNAKGTTKVNSTHSTKKDDRRVPSKPQLTATKGIRKQKKPQTNLVPKCSLLKTFISSQNYSSVTSVADQFNFLQAHTKNSV